MTNIEKDITLFKDKVEEFYNKAITCDLKGIVGDVRYLDLMANRIRSNLSNMEFSNKRESHRTNFTNSNSKYISAEYIIDECICTKAQNSKKPHPY